MLACLLAVTAATAVAPIWAPLRVQIELAEPDSEGASDVKQFSWTYQGDRWLLALPETALNDYRALRITGPGGTAPVQVDDLELGIANGLVTMAGPEWDQCYRTGKWTSNVHHLLEVWQDDRWSVFRLIWPIGGASGPPPVPLVTIAQERHSGSWAALATSFDHEAARGGDTHGLDVLDDGQLVVWCWRWHTQSVLARKTWLVSSTKGGVQFRREASKFMLNTYNGIPSTLAADPRDAVHWGYQEVAWRVRSVTPAGGEVVAFDRSPRRIEDEDDISDGLIVPSTDAPVQFAWLGEVYLVPYRQKGYWVSASVASELAARGGWDVVLFRRRSGRVVAERLVQHQRNFPHSTPAQ